MSLSYDNLLPYDILCHIIYIVTFPAQITCTFHSRHVTAHGAEMKLHIKTWVREDLVFMLLALKVHARKTYFLQYHICVKTFHGIL